MRDRRFNRMIRRAVWIAPLTGLSLLQVGGCSFAQDLQSAVLNGAIQSVSNGVFSATQTLFLNVFRL